ncbi:hypothetical protein D3C71_2075120 [compost metagenome]
MVQGSRHIEIIKYKYKYKEVVYRQGFFNPVCGLELGKLFKGYFMAACVLVKDPVYHSGEDH